MKFQTRNKSMENHILVILVLIIILAAEIESMMAYANGPPRSRPRKTITSKEQVWRAKQRPIAKSKNIRHKNGHYNAQPPIEDREEHHIAKGVNEHPKGCWTNYHKKGECVFHQQCPHINVLANYYKEKRHMKRSEIKKIISCEGIKNSVCCGYRPPLDLKHVNFGDTKDYYENRKCTKTFYGSLPTIASECCGLIPDSPDINKYKDPWTVQLRTHNTRHNMNYEHCHGILISNNWVLTAAHCVKNREKLRVHLGQLNCGDDWGCKGTIVSKIRKFIIHEEYTNDHNTKQYNDIALVKLYTNVEFTDYIRPICLPDVNVNDVKKLYFNKIYSDGTNHKINMKYISRQICQRYFVPKNYTERHITERHVCAASNVANGISEGDSGGPLVWQRGNVSIAVGIDSFGPNNDNNKITYKLDVFTNIYSYIDWIHYNIKIDSQYNIKY